MHFGLWIADFGTSVLAFAEGDGIPGVSHYYLPQSAIRNPKSNGGLRGFCDSIKRNMPGVSQYNVPKSAIRNPK
jgi:hypothetical protein